MSNRESADRHVGRGQADGERAAFEDRTSGKHQRSCLTTPLGLEEQEMEMDGGKVSEREKKREREGRGQSETSAEEDRETWRNAATAPSLKNP